MLKAKVYKSFDSLLYKRGYIVSSISTEKHGLVSAEDLKKLGYSDTLKIPVPFMVWLNIKKASV